MTLARRKTPTVAERSYQDAARELGCVVCRYRIRHGMQPDQPGPTEIHHRNGGDNHGQKQLGQHAVVALCSYHHRGMPLWGWGDEEMREVYGPSFAGSPRDFREWTYDALPNLPGKGTERWQNFQDLELEASGV